MLTSASSSRVLRSAVVLAIQAFPMVQTKMWLPQERILKTTKISKWIWEPCLQSPRSGYRTILPFPVRVVNELTKCNTLFPFADRRWEVIEHE